MHYSNDRGFLKKKQGRVAVQGEATGKRSSTVHVLVASLVGTSIEWYDFYIFGIAAALVLGPQFFPQMSPTASLLASFATFGVGFFARPIGAAIFGHYGDRVGRRSMLIISLMMMGGATIAIGCLPNFASIGIWAPILLVALRIIQGAGLGGEWGGAALMAAEYAPDSRRGAFVGWPQFGTAAGLMLANGAFLLVRAFMTQDDFVSWGWRIPFLASVVLVVFGFIIRFNLHETPAFEKIKQSGEISKAPLLEVFRLQPGRVALVAGAFLFNATAFYIITTFTLAYSRTVPGLKDNPNIPFIANMVGAVGLGIGVVLFSALSDRIGRKWTILPLYLSWIVWVFVMFWLVNMGTLTAFVFAIGVGTFLTSAHGPLGALYLEQFDTRVRYTGAGVGQQIGAIVGGGLGPLLAIQLNASYGLLAVELYVILIALISSVAVMACREAAGQNIEISQNTVTNMPPEAAALHPAKGFPA
jgi:MFS family permease